MNKIPVLDTITSAYRFTFTHLGTIIGFSWVGLVLIAVLQFLPYAFGGDPFATPENATVQGHRGLTNFASTLLMLLLYSIIYVPVTQLALGLRKGPALWHFSLGMPEFRLFGAFLLFLLVMMAMIVGMGLLSLVLGGIALTMGKNAILGLVFALIVFAAILGIIYAIVRLGYLIAPVTVAESHVSLIRGWMLTAGNFWRIVAVLLGVLLPIYLLYLIGLIAIAGPQLFAPLPAETAQAQQALMQRFAMIGQHMPAYLGLTLILAPFSIGLAVSASAFGYRALASGLQPGTRPVAG